MGQLRDVVFISSLFLVSFPASAGSTSAGSTFSSIPKSKDCAFVKSVAAELVFEEDIYTHRLLCQDGKAIERKRIFNKNKVVSSLLKYSKGIPHISYTYNSQSELTAAREYEFTNNGNVIISRFEINNQKPGRLKEKVEMVDYDVESYDVQEQSYTLKRWFYSKKEPKKLEFIATYEKQSHRIIRKDYLDEKGKLVSYITFKYEGEKEKPIGFKEWSASGKEINSYDLYEKFDPEAALQESNLSQKELERRLKHQSNPKRFLIGMIDSGFDYNHPELAWKWWSNPLDPVDGLDNDGNGWIDDQFGWDREGQVALPSETTANLASTELKYPDSHGTHVAHILSRDLEDIALIGFAGDYTQAKYIDQISDFILQHRLKIVNMSFGLPHDIKDSLNLRKANRALVQMALDNPQTLFVVSAGNSGHDIDQFENKQYPASINLPNVMKVGSLETNEIIKDKRHLYKKSPTSNFGANSVDILAPGKDISAARLGGGEVVHSGTSMAAPYVARQAARLWMRFPTLTASQVRQIFIETAYVMSPRAEISSGGFVDFEKATEMAKLIYPSVACPEKSSLHPITCCLDDKLCEKAIESIPMKMKERAELVHKTYFNGGFDYGAVPNCHWSVASRLLSQTLPLKPFEDWKLENLISENGGVEIPLSEVQAGDLVLFYFVGKERHEPTTPGGAWSWQDHTSFEHSAVALSEDVIFQKENYGSHVFSVASIEATRKAYEDSFLKSGARRYRGQMIVRAFRPR